MNIEILKNIALGAFYGFQAAIFGYLKDENLPKSWSIVFTKAFWTKFSPVKAIKTIIIGAGLGAFGVVKTEYNLDIVTINFFNTIIVTGTDQLVKLIVRRTPIVKVWNAIKAKFLKLPVQ
jgi:hypothetical protein